MRLIITKGLSFLLLLSGVLAIHEDQFGLFDWKQSFIGHVTHASYDAVPDSSGSRAIFVASAETGVFGALAAKDGGVIWRHTFGVGERLSFITLFSDCILVLTGNAVRCFYPEGILKSQVTLPLGEHENVKLLSAHENSVLLASEFHFCTIHGNKFDCVPIPSNIGGNKHILSCEDSNSGCVISQDAAGHVTVYMSAVKQNAKLVKLSQGNMEDQIVSCGSMVDQKSYVCLLASGKVVGPVEFKQFSTANMGYIDSQTCSFSAEGEKVLAMTIVANNILLTYTDGRKQLCDLKNRKLLSFGNVDMTVVAAAKADYDGTTVAFVMVNEGGHSHRLLLLDDAGTLLAESPFTSRRIMNEGTESIFPVVLKKRGGTKSSTSPILRCLIKTRYDTLFFIQGGNVKWTRDEGLGQAMSSIFFDLPLPGYLADIANEVVSKDSNIFFSFARRVRFESDILFSTIFDLVDTFSDGGFGALLNFHKDTTHSLLHHHVNRHTGDGRDVALELYRDKFGLEKLILVLTRPGKVFAIHSLTGVVVWDLLLGDCNPMSIFQLRGTDYAGMSSLVAVAGRDESSNGQLCLVAFDGMTGQIQDTKTFPFLPGVVRLYAKTDPSDHVTPLLLMLPSRSSLYVYPPSSTEFVTKSSSNVYFYLATEKIVNNAELNGFAMIKPQSQVLPTDILELAKTWTVALPKGEHILTVAERRVDERVYSKAVVLSDRTVLYRYLNPNLIFVVTATIPEGRQEAEKESLSVYLIDSVSGRFYFQGQHRNARGPIHAINAENFAVYSYWNSQMRRSEISVIELFEGKFERNGTAFSSFDYYGPDVPMVLKQSYVLNDHVCSMGVTTSRKGITSRSILLGLASGRILEVPKVLLNPRRLLIHTQELAEEGIPPYIPEIMQHPEAFVNYNRTLGRIAHMQTAASGLESTTLLFVSGLDLYFVRVWPSKMFDMIKEDFDYLFIIMLTCGLFAATIVFRYMVQLKELKKAWQ